MKLYSRHHSLSPSDDIVLSGMSGKFPNSKNIDELSHNLYNKIDMVDDAVHRWGQINFEFPQRMGKIGRIDKFDAKFFEIEYKLGHAIDPQSRILLETAYEAIIDAGINPNALKNSKTGVYMALSISDAENVWCYDKITTGGYGILGCTRSMIANRISMAMQLNGPSILIDTACSASMTAIDSAFNAMRNGEIDAALVGGSNLMSHPNTTLFFSRLGTLAKDGFCRPFDINACGFTRSEGICVIFLQKAKNAKRIYSTLIYSKINSDGYKTEGITYPSGAIQEKLLTEFYEDININPMRIHFVEAHCTGTIVGDPEECQALGNVYCKQRTQSLLVGTIKSNIGHTEAASGVSAIVKVHLAFETQFIAPNMNFTQNRPEIKALENGSLKVCSETTRLNGSLIAINSFGFGGSNAHILLEQHSQIKESNGLPKDGVARLIFWSGRTEQSIETILNDIQTRPIDTEYCALLNSIHTDKIVGNNYRGYAIYEQENEKNATEICRRIEFYNGRNYPIVWIFGGPGKEFTEISKDFFQLPIFRQTIQKCDNLLSPFGVSLIDVLTSNNTKSTNNILDIFISSVAVQIGFIDILRQLNIKPDYIIGYSIGEFACCYADNVTTIDETIIATYILAVKLSSANKTVIVEATQNCLTKILPATIQLIYYNKKTSTSIVNGPESDIRQFKLYLKEKNIFVDDLFSNDSDSEVFDIINYLNKIFSIKNIPFKWIDRSNSKKEVINNGNHNNCKNDYVTDEILNKFADPIISSKLLQQNCQKLPKRSLLIKITANDSLNEIWNITGGTHFTLVKKPNKNNLIGLLKTLGDLFIFGLDLPINNLYPPVTFPVSRGTRIISPLIKWDHADTWYVTEFHNSRKCQSTERKIMINLNDPEYEFISGYIIDGKCLVPTAAYIQMVWNTFGLINGFRFNYIDVQFQDIRFLRSTVLTGEQPVEFVIRNQLGTGHFEIVDGVTAIVTGIINKLKKHSTIASLPTPPSTDFPMLTEEDFYKELYLRGYHINGDFLGVQSARGDGLYGQIKWELNNWITFIDCILQVNLLTKDSRSLMLPTRIERLQINSKNHMELVSMLNPKNSVFDVFYNKESNFLVSGGIEIIGLYTNIIVRRESHKSPVLQSYKFIPYLPAPKLDITNAVRVCVQIAVENNLNMSQIKVLEMNLNGRHPIIQHFWDALNDTPLITYELSLITEKKFSFDKINIMNTELSNFSNLQFIISSEFDQQQGSSLHDNGYLILRTDTDKHFTDIPVAYQLICEISMESENLRLLQKIKRHTEALNSPAIIKISNSDKNYDWIEKYKNIMKHKSVILYSQNEKCTGLIGLTKCIRMEPHIKQTICFLIEDAAAPAFDISNSFYHDQLKLGLAFNIYRNGKWGSYKHLSLNIDTEAVRRNDHCIVDVLQKGDLSTICWLQGPIQVKNEEKFVNVQYTALNIRDIMISSGIISVELLINDRLRQENLLGFEFSGINKNNEKLMGIVQSGALATQIIPSDYLTWIVPNHWSLRDAATCPIIYLTVYTAFFKYVKIAKGKSILIHAGSGGVGLAAIRVALAYDLDVYCTASNDVKKMFIMKEYPNIKESHIGTSKNCSFETMIKIGTNGKGVDYVLNPFSNNKLHASLRCVARGGTFFEIGKSDQSNDIKIGLHSFLKGINYRPIHVDTLCIREFEDTEYITKLIDTDIKSGIIQPITSQEFNVNEIEQSTRYLSTGKDIGKVVIKIRDDPYGKSNPIRVLPRAYFDPNLVYIIAGGLGGFGLELADWLVLRGARKIILGSKRGITKMYQLYRIKLLERYSCKIDVNTSEMTNYEGCHDLINAAMKMGSIGGIFNLAVVMRDALMENQTANSFAECMAPKAIATKYLDELSRKLCPQLKYFVIFSSISSGRGFVGQGNYGMANSVMEEIIEQRAELGLPAKAIQWGAIGDVGVLADMKKQNIEINGTFQQKITSCFQILDILLLSSDPITSDMVIAEKRTVSENSESLLESILIVLGIRDIKSISMVTTLSEAGMDSLMTAVIQQKLEREFEMIMAVQDLRSLTFAKIKELSDAHTNDTGKKRNV